jgi:hypothetical protein
MSDLNRTFRERLFDRVVLRTLGVLFLIAFICPVLTASFSQHTLTKSRFTRTARPALNCPLRSVEINVRCWIT